MTTRFNTLFFVCIMLVVLITPAMAGLDRIVLMGGDNWWGYLNDTWNSTDSGTIWTQVNASSGWTERVQHTSVVLPNGTIVLMGGTTNGVTQYNDTWWSTDYGATWTLVNPSSGWTMGSYLTSVVLPDGSIVLMGCGVVSNETWRSTDGGVTWTQQTPGAGWTGRWDHTSVVMSDGSIVLMGGEDIVGNKNDVWRSTDKGVTWVERTPGAGWSARYGHTSVVLPGDTIVLMGGFDNIGFGDNRNDVWKSLDYGATWTQVNASAGWPKRREHTSVVMSDGSIVLMGGRAGAPMYRDTWRSTDGGNVWTQVNASADWVWRYGHTAVVVSDIPHTGSVSINSVPSGATIYLDGIYKGLTPQSLENIPFGVHVVKLTLDNYQDWSGNVELTAASPSASVNPILNPVPPTPPVANFIATPTFGKAPLHVQFTDLSANGPLAWAWSFGDGGTSTERNPLHQFTKEGKYAVSLKVSNAFGSSKETKKGYIIVTSSVPVADFTATPITGPAPLHVQFTDTSSNSPTSWQWNFGDGGTSIEQNPLYTYLSTGTYTVSLKATNAFGSDTVKKAKYVKVTRPEVCDATGPYIDFVINNVNYGPECTPGAWQSAVCYDNAVIRWALAGESTPFHDILSNWMWKRNDNCPDSGHSFAVDQPYGKDIHIAGVKNTDIGWYHAVDAELRTGKDPANWNSWKFFNYDNLDIKKGDYQIPAGTSICRTKVWIRQIDSVFGCGAYDGQIGSTFYIDSKLKIQSSQDPNCPESPLLSKMGASFNENQKLPDSILKAVKSIGHETPFGISKWETDPTIKEMTIYAYDIQDENKINALSGIQIENYTIKIVKDKEFETTRADVQKQLLQLRKNPEYQIGGISMITDAFGEPPGNYAELWVYNSTPANKKLENTIIQGWEILVYPVSV